MVRSLRQETICPGKVLGAPATSNSCSRPWRHGIRCTRLGVVGWAQRHCLELVRRPLAWSSRLWVTVWRWQYCDVMQRQHGTTGKLIVRCTEYGYRLGKAKVMGGLVRPRLSNTHTPFPSWNPSDETPLALGPYDAAHPLLFLWLFSRAHTRYGEQQWTRALSRGQTALVLESIIWHHGSQYPLKGRGRRMGGWMDEGATIRNLAACKTITANMEYTGYFWLCSLQGAVGGRSAWLPVCAPAATQVLGELPHRKRVPSYYESGKSPSSCQRTFRVHPYEEDPILLSPILSREFQQQEEHLQGSYFSLVSLAGAGARPHPNDPSWALRVSLGPGGREGV